MACGILLPQPGIEPVPFALEAQSLKPLDQPYYLTQKSPGYHSSLTERSWAFLCTKYSICGPISHFFSVNTTGCAQRMVPAFLQVPQHQRSFLFWAFAHTFPSAWNMLSSHLPVPSGCKLSAISSKVSSLVIQFREYTLFLPLTAPHLLYVYRAKYMLIS